MLGGLKIPRDKLRQGSRKFLLWLVVGGIGAIFFGVTAEWVIRLLDERGFFAEPTQRAGQAASVVGSVLGSMWFLLPAAFVVGLTAGVWLDWLLRRNVVERPNPAVALQELRKEGVRYRNALLLPSDALDCSEEWDRLVDWSDRTVQTMKEGNIAVKVWSAFEILDNFEPKLVGTSPRSPAQIKLETIWNRKLDLLRGAIDLVGG